MKQGNETRDRLIEIGIFLASFLVPAVALAIPIVILSECWKP
jgi:hypothetical protein